MARAPIRQTRKVEQAAEKYETYAPPSQYDIPPQVLKIFNDKGYHLRWIRVTLDNSDDYKNVARRRREGYEPVMISELPEDVRDLFETKSFGPGVAKYTNIAMVGDLALFKVTLGKAKARTRYYEQLAVNNELAQRKQLGGQSRLNKLLPIIDESRSEIRTGNRQSAPEEFGKTLRSTQASDDEGYDSIDDAE
jgi:hypothetical protein